MAVRMLVNGDTTSSHTPTTTEAAGGSQDAASESLLAKLQWMGITEQHFIGVDCSKVKNDEEETVLVHTAGMLWAKSLWEGKKRIRHGRKDQGHQLSGDQVWWKYPQMARELQVQTNLVSQLPPLEPLDSSPHVAVNGSLLAEQP